MGKRAAAAAIAILCGLYFLILAPPVVAAGDVPPDTFEINTSAVATNLAEEGDYLFLCEYECSWELDDSYPSDPISDKVVLQVYDPETETVLATTAPYPYWNSGYDKGIIGIYFSPVEAIASSLEWEKSLILRLVSFPGEFSSSAVYEYILPTNEYCTSGTTSQEANRDWIREYCLNTADTLEANWGVATALTMQSMTMVLSTAGEAYYIRVMPGLRELVPRLFLATDEVPAFTETEYTGTHSTALQEQWDDDSIVEDGIDGLGGIMGGDSVFAMNFLVVGMMIVVLVVSGATLKAIAPGLLAGAMIMLTGADLGWLEAVVLGVLEFVWLLYGVNRTVRLNQI